MKTKIPTTFEIALAVKRARARLGMTQPEFAAYVSLSEQVIFALEAEKRPYVRVRKLAKLAALLNVSTSWLHPTGRLRSGKNVGQREALQFLDEDDAARMRARAADYPEVERPRTRADCLTAKARLRLAVLQAREEGRDPDTVTMVDAGGPENGHNCARPCPFVSCAFHLYLDVGGTSKAPYLTINFPEIEPHQMATLSVPQLDRLLPETRKRLAKRSPGRLIPSCAADVADHRTWLLGEVGTFLGITREGVRRIIKTAVKRMVEEADDATEAEAFIRSLDFDLASEGD